LVVDVVGQGFGTRRDPPWMSTFWPCLKTVLFLFCSYILTACTELSRSVWVVPPCLRLRRANSPPDCLLTLLSPLPFALDLDPCAVDQQVQRSLRSAIRNVDLQGLLAAAQGAEVRHSPVQVDQVQQALDEPCRLPERHAEQDLHRQAGLDRFLSLITAVVGLPTTLAGRRGLPGHGGIKPALRRLKAIACRPVDRQRAPPLERVRRWARTNGASPAYYRASRIIPD